MDLTKATHYSFSVPIISNERTKQYYRFRKLIYICPALGIFWALAFNVMKLDSLSTLSVLFGFIGAIIFSVLVQVIDRHKKIGTLTFGESGMRIITKAHNKFFAAKLIQHIKFIYKGFEGEYSGRNEGMLSGVDNFIEITVDGIVYKTEVFLAHAKDKEIILTFLKLYTEGGTIIA